MSLVLVASSIKLPPQTSDYDHVLRGAISFTPWLQPGDKAHRKRSLNLFQRFLVVYRHQTVETVLFCLTARGHRAEATV